MASIAEPFLLHSYPVPATAGPSNCKGLPHVQASGRLDDAPEITVTVQGDGIHSYDRSSLHPVSSYTLGPATYFQSTASSRLGKGAKRSTYVAVAAGPDIKDKGKTAWVWPEGSEDTASRRAVELSWPAQDVLFATAHSSQAIISSSSGHLTLASSDLERIYELSPPFRISGAPRTFLFPKLRHTVGTVAGSTHQAITLSFFGDDSGQFGVWVVKIVDDKLEGVAWEPLGDMKAKDVVSLSCEPSGNASVLLSSGQCCPFRISVSSSVCCIPSSVPIAAIKSKSSPDLPQTSVLSIMSTHVLIASASPSRQVQLELWDTRYPVQLASHSLALPSSVPHTFAVYLTHAAMGQALLTFTSLLGAKKGDGKARSSVFVVPYTIPSASTLLNALGRLQVSESASLEEAVGLSDSQREFVKTLAEALRARKSDEAQTTFFDWINAQTQPTTNGNHTATQPDGESEQEETGETNGITEEDSDEEATLTNGREVNGTAGPSTTPANKPLLSLPPALVEQLVDVLLSPPQTATTAHSAILRFLLGRGLISYSMVKGDQKLLDILLERRDWLNMTIALQSVVDIPESAIVGVLKAGLQNNDPAPSLPLPNVVAAIIAAPVTKPALRLALREQITDMADVCRMMQVLQDWLVQSGFTGLELDAQAGVVQVDYRPKPQIDAILSFAETLIDTYFISLLQYPPARPILQSLSALLAPQLELATQLERLRGPLELFAKRKRLQKQSGVPQKSVSRFEEGRRRKRAQEEVELQVGLYSVEDVFF